MTTATFSEAMRGYGYSNPIYSIVAGVSDAAEFIQSVSSKIQKSKLETVTGSKDDAISSKAFENLIELFEEENVLSYEAFNEAIHFLKNLPLGIELPDAGVEPNGAISFEWYKGESEIFVISINGTKSLEYAAIMGRGNEFHGKQGYFGGHLPSSIKAILEIFLSH